MIKIAFDLDGVVINTFPLLRQLFIDHWSHDITPHKQFEFTIPGKTKEETNNLWFNNLEDITYNSPPLDNSILYLTQIYSINRLPLIFITARAKKQLKRCTKTWLKKYLGDIPFKVIHIKGKYKIKVLKTLGIKYFVDDRFRTINQITPHIVKAYLYDQSWNTGRRAKHPNIKRIKSLKEIVDNLYKI